MYLRNRFWIVALICAAGPMWSVLMAGSPQQAGGGAPSPPPARDHYQRSLHIYEFKVTADSGEQRGEELFYFKCSFCHNRYAKRELMRDVMYAPPLEGYLARQRPERDSEPQKAVAERRLRAKILGGGSSMPSYRYTLAEADINDLVAYVLGGRCCVDGNDPPPNPRYIAGPPVKRPSTAAPTPSSGGSR